MTMILNHLVNVEPAIDYALDMKKPSVQIIRRVHLLHINLYHFLNNQMKNNLYQIVHLYEQ